MSVERTHDRPDLMAEAVAAQQGRRVNAVHPGLAERDFALQSTNGFGDPANSYVHCMTEFCGSVFAGTSRHSMALLKLFPPPEAPLLEPWPVSVPASVEDLDLHGQVWKLEPTSSSWERAYTSPDIIGRQGKDVPRDLGYRGMTVFQGRSDPTPALYVGAISTVLRGTAARLLRSLDGEEFSAVGEPGLGNPKASTLRSMIGFDGQLFVPPAGEGIQLNSSSASTIMRSPDPARGPWTAACPPGFGDPTNAGIFEMAVFANHLYAGTFNAVTGYQVWKTAATGSRPCRWTKVVDRGAYRGPVNEIAMSMCVFDGALFIGSAIQNGGYDRVHRIGPAAAELIRIRADDSWDLVIGEPRRTPQGWKEPLSGMGPGFDSIFNGYLWRMVVHDGWLYASTFDWSVFLPFANNVSPAASNLLAAFGSDEVVERAGGFELWRTRDGSTWIPVTRTGFGNPYNYGARTLVSTSRGMFVGTANPFGPNVPARFASGWQYVTNPRGGAEVWIGNNSDQSETKAETTVHRGGRHRGSVLITGVTGFVGRALLPLLIERGNEITVLAEPTTIAALDTYAGDVEIVVGDLSQQDQLKAAVDGVETVLHLAAALPGASAAVLHQVNVEGTRNLLATCAQASNLRRFVMTSTAAVYADAFEPQAWPLKERAPLGPRGPAFLRPYAWSKVAAERLLNKSAAERKFTATVLRPSNCYGLGDPLIEHIIRDGIRTAGEPPRPQSLRDAQTTRQYLHVTDLAEVLALAVNSPSLGEDVFHVAGPDAMSLTAMHAFIARLCFGSAASNAAGPLPVVLDRFQYPYDLSKLHHRLGFRPRITLREGLSEILQTIDLDQPDLLLESGFARMDASS